MDCKPACRPVGLPFVSSHAHRGAVVLFSAERPWSSCPGRHPMVPDQRFSGGCAAVTGSGSGLLLWSPPSERSRGSGVTRAKERPKEVTFHLDELLESRGLTLT